MVCGCVGAGTIGRFDFQALLLSLTSSLALLAVAKTAIDFLAFNVLPLKFIYKQYRVIDVRATRCPCWFSL